MLRNLLSVLFVLLILLMVMVDFVSCQTSVLKGSIEGLVIDADTKTSLIGTNVIIVGTVMGAATDINGKFFIKNIPVGNYVLQFDYIGYQQIKKTDIIVRSQRTTFVAAEMKIEPLKTETVSVTAGYFSNTESQPTSVISFDNEEIRRAPGSAGDVSRIMMSLPGLAKVNDQSNNLIVRGGNPIENTFYIDNIEIPNINHFPHQAASGGPIGILNVDFIQDVAFLTGGFSAAYGDKLSSIMDIKFREGNRSEFDGQLDLNWAGFGGVFEGPLFKKSSWLFSVRRSYLDFVVDKFDVGSTVAPIYGDIQAKIVYDLNSNYKLTLLCILADDHNAPDKKTGEENYMTHYGNQDLYQSTFGLNWPAIWGKSGYSNTSLSTTINTYDEDFYETFTGKYDIKNRTDEQTYKFRNVNHFRLNKKHAIEFGIDAKYLTEKHDNWYAATTNDIGEPVPELYLKDEISAEKAGGFVSYIYQPFYRLQSTFGLRADYFSRNKETSLSPRLALSYQLTQRAKFNGSTGIFYQNLPLLLLSQNDKFSALKNLKAIHYILGIEYLLTENTKLTLEIYQKKYENFPMDPLQPAIFIIDNNYFSNYQTLQDNGKAESKGIELMVQKKLAQNFYGLASVSYFRSRYLGLDDTWRNRSYDNRFTFSFEGGFKPNHKWEFSARWIFAGGVPYTPFDNEKSAQYHHAVYDESRINQDRYPDYHSMNVRLDRRFFFSHSDIVFYLSVWNVYDQKNIANYFWNDKQQKIDEVYQWRLLPIFGVEWEM